MTNCLKVMTIPLEDGFFFGGEVQKYACINWCHHFHQVLIKRGPNLIHSLISNTLMTCLTDFLFQSFELWINTLISAYQMENVLHALDSVLLKLKVSVMCAVVLNNLDEISTRNSRTIYQTCYKSYKISEGLQRY